MSPFRFPFVRTGLLLLAIIVAGACNREQTATTPEFGVRPDGRLAFLASDSTILHSINIEIADTRETRQRGLMERRGMRVDEGMLFIFPAPDMLSFWMRNTAMPLDIIFVDEGLNIVNIAQRTKPLSDQYIRATAPVQYVVEVRGGVTERFGITDAASVRWQRHAD